MGMHSIPLIVSVDTEISIGMIDYDRIAQMINPIGEDYNSGGSGFDWFTFRSSHINTIMIILYKNRIFNKPLGHISIYRRKCGYIVNITNVDTLIFFQIHQL